MYAQAVVDALNAKHSEYNFEVSGGRKYIRISKESKLSGGQGRSVAMFVDATTGEFLKAAGWATPAKGVRYAPTSEADAVRIINEHSDSCGGWLYRR